MGPLPRCSLVTDVRGLKGVGPERVALTLARHRFLRFFLAGPPARCVWLDRDKKHISQVAEPFAYDPRAVAVKVYRLGDGEDAGRGEAWNIRILSVVDLRALVHLWAIPLRELNAEGQALARGPGPQPAVVRSLKVPWEVDRAWAAEARAAGTTVTALILDAMAGRSRKDAA